MTANDTNWGQDGPEEIDPVSTIVEQLRDPSRDEHLDADKLAEGLDILRRRSE